MSLNRQSFSCRSDCRATGAGQLAIIAALTGALLTVVPGPLDSEAFAVGREFAFQLFVSAALVSRLYSEGEFAVDRADLAFLIFLMLAWVSAVQASVQPFASRAIGLTTATVGMWFSVRGCDARFRHCILMTIVCLGVIIAAVAWAEALGWVDKLSDPGRGPGGLYGNRNRMSHVLVLCLPAACYLLSTSVSRVATAYAFSAVSLMIGILVLSRSRTAWMGALTLVLVGLGSLLRARHHFVLKDLRRIVLIAAATASGAGIVRAVPTQIAWTSNNPYADSFKSMLEIHQGSGRARVRQQLTTFRMIMDAPMLGVGPGNWQVQYGRYAQLGDSSYIPMHIVPTNRLPHGDWVGISAELGIPALAVLFIFFAIIMSQLWARQPGGGSVVAAATLLALLVMGLADPVFLTPAPAAVAIAIAASWLSRETILTTVSTNTKRFIWIACAMPVLGRPLLFAAKQVYGDYLRRTSVSVADLIEATRWNEADFVSRVIIGRALVSRGRCDIAINFAREAYRLYPTSLAPLYVFERCVPNSKGPKT